jgi:FkbM family methyltransferase
MRAFLKKIVNSCLDLVKLKPVHARNNNRIGVNLFDDLRQLINKESPVCLDVGANKGQTIDSLRRAFRNPYIYAFEPSTKTFKILKSKELGDRIFLYNKALAKKRQNREFINYNRHTLSSFLPLDSDVENRFREVGVNNKEIVEVDTVDRFLHHENIEDVDLLKIDTQGFDLEVLLGAKNALRSGVIRNVLIELNFVRMYEGQCSPEDVISMLKENDILLIDYYEKERQNYTLAWCTALFGRR